MAACGGSQHWARCLRELGFAVRVVRPKFVKACAQGNKNDGNDAAAICEAAASTRMKTARFAAWHSRIVWCCTGVVSGS